ncbi:hypothetical protein BDM02DRAFT_3097205 [Thelephora ganbajun]|uniref:Uncharacterized protein n=1 Tax=Thelephora ganbajun TaxID=370292 RepID=A0ACB6ZEI3_THEGA|nr:hypothetical protein BDM02DRAFT_3097205 [Thelephora ganbajun]
MPNSFHDSTPSSRSRTRDSENLRSHSSHRELRAREVASHAAELSNLLDKCKLLESTLKARDKEIHDLRKERDLLLEERKRMQRRMAQQEAAQATAVANALAAVTRSAPTPPPKPPKTRSSTMSRSHPEDSGSSSAESSPTPSSNKTYRTSTTSMTSIQGLPTFQDEYIAHLRSFDVFMTKTDSWSGAQVIQAVRDLNSEILQFSASLTELHYAIDTNNGGTRPVMHPNVLSQAKQNTATRLGVPFMHVLSTRDHSQDLSMLVQFALQATLCAIIDRTLTSFCVGFPAKYDALLNQLYLRMCSSEPQATSSRWRSMTHRYITTLFPTLEEQALDDLVDDALRWSMDILTLSGTPIPKDNLRNRFEPQLRRVAQSVLRIAAVTKEQVLSTNFEVISAEVGRDFERRRMVNLFDEYYTGGAKDGNGERVLCTTEVGLKCCSGDGVDERTLIQPTVILESVVQVI